MSANRTTVVISSVVLAGLLAGLLWYQLGRTPATDDTQETTQEPASTAGIALPETDQRRAEPSETEQAFASNGEVPVEADNDNVEPDGKGNEEPIAQDVAPTAATGPGDWLAPLLSGMVLLGGFGLLKSKQFLLN